MAKSSHPANRTPDSEGVLTHAFIRTASGRVIHIGSPEDCIEDIVSSDIAHGLSHYCRFGGHTVRYYSVAQHCCICHDLATPPDKLWLLLHDAPEAYMGDLVSPLKRLMADFWKPLEARWETAIRKRFCCPESDGQERRAKAIDILVLGREMLDLMPFGCEDQLYLGYLDSRRPAELPPIVPWGPEQARREYLNRLKLYV